MEGDIPYMPIRQFESENMEKLLQTDMVRDTRVKVKSNPPRQSQFRDFSDGYSYSDTVDLILEGMGLEKYIPNFRENDIGVNILFQMNTTDLSVIGMISPKDQACFKRHVLEFNGSPSVKSYELYKIEEDLIMARNVCHHLEDIKEHLNFILFHLKTNDYEDYFVEPDTSILRVFDIVANRTVTQAKRMAQVIFNGSLKGDNLIGGYLRADGLRLPEYMLVRLLHPNKDISSASKKSSGYIVGGSVTISAALAAGFFIFNKYFKN